MKILIVLCSLFMGICLGSYYTSAKYENHIVCIQNVYNKHLDKNAVSQKEIDVCIAQNL